MFRAFAETETGDARRKKIPADIVHLDGKPDPHLLGPRSEWQDDVRNPLVPVLGSVGWFPLGLLAPLMHSRRGCIPTPLDHVCISSHVR